MALDRDSQHGWRYQYRRAHYLRGNLADLVISRRRYPADDRSGRKFFDNSSGLIEDVESQRFAGLEDPADVMREESRISSRLRSGSPETNEQTSNLGLGFEAPLRLGQLLHQPAPGVDVEDSDQTGLLRLFIPDMDDPDAPMGGGDGF